MKMMTTTARAPPTMIRAAMMMKRFGPLSPRARIVVHAPNEQKSDVCPPGCDEGLYNAVLALREERLELKEKVDSIGADISKIKTDYKNLMKAKGVDSDYQVSASSLAAFRHFSHTAVSCARLRNSRSSSSSGRSKAA